jgi:hypothetical protein
MIPVTIDHIGDGEGENTQCIGRQQTTQDGKNLVYSQYHRAATYRSRSVKIETQTPWWAIDDHNKCTPAASGYNDHKAQQQTRRFV